MSTFKEVMKKAKYILFEVEWDPEESSMGFVKTWVAANTFDQAVALVTDNIYDVRSVRRLNPLLSPPE